MSDAKITKNLDRSRSHHKALKFAAVIALITLAAGGVYRSVFIRSTLNVALAELQTAYKTERPTESRIVGFDHAPWLTERGLTERGLTDRGESGRQQILARDRAERLLTIAAGENNDAASLAASLAALGKFYLTERKFEKAVDLFEQAEQSGLAKAGVFADHGSALFELARESSVLDDRALTFQLLDKSLGQFDAAIKITPNSPEAIYNRALCLESLYLKEQAKNAWRNYIATDDSSKWAAEARDRLNRLETVDSGDISAKDLLERFVAAASEKDGAKATELITNTRELITQKYLPQSLAMAVTESPRESRATLLDALVYAGEIEQSQTNDKFAARIASFYKSRNADQLDRLRVAHTAVKNGYRLCLALKYADANTEFVKSQSIFALEGNDLESQLAEYFVGYSLVNSKKVEEGLVIFERVVAFARREKYRWLEMTALYWVAGAKNSLRRLAEGIVANKAALAIAESIDDKYAIQRNLAEMSANLKFVQQSGQALGLSRRILEVSDGAMWSLRQRQRNAYYIATLWSSADLPNAVRACALESIALSDRLGDKMFRTNSRGLAGTIFTQTGDPALAKKFFDESNEIARTIEDENSRNRVIALIHLQTAEALESIGDIENATERYKAADDLFKLNPLSYQQYMAKRGLLKGLRKLGRTVELDEQLPGILAEIEQIRDQIVAENERSSFFDKGVTVYDMAVERQIEKANFAEAFNYSEFSTSRTLVERLEAFRTRSVVRPDQLDPGVSRPMTINEIQHAMPESVQIVKYTVLESKLLIWVISKTKFTVLPINIAIPQLREQVENYVRLVKRGYPGDAETIRELGATLHTILLDPIEGELDSDKSLCIVPNKFLFYVPFASLENSIGEPLIKTFNLLYAPSATIFVLNSNIAANKRSDNAEKLLAIGDPRFDRSSFENLPDLPDAVSEVQDIQRHYAMPSVFTDVNATKAGFISSMKTADVVHFAGHYVVVDREPEASYLLFSAIGKNTGSSILTNGELNKLSFPRTKLIVLAACRSGLDDYFDGEGIVGLTRTFIAGGVPVVVASQWNVDSAAAAELMKKFHAHRRNDAMNTSRALRAAQLDLATEPNGRFNSPYYWAAFAVFGGYSEY